MLLVRASVTVPPSGYWAEPSASMSVPCSSASLAMLRTKSWKISFLATKSVSEFTSTTAPRLPSTTTPTSPSAAVRPAFFAAAERPLARSQSIAASISPSVSERAFLQSIMPAPVRSRSSFTLAAVISAIFVSFCTKPFAPSLSKGCLALPTEGQGFDFAQPERKIGVFSSGFQRGFGRRLGHLADVLALRDGLAGPALGHRLRDSAGVEADRAAGVVIARDGKCDARRVAVRIEDRDDRNAEHIGFLDRQLFLVRVDDEHHVGKTAHVANAAKALLELVAFAGELE